MASLDQSFKKLGTPSTKNGLQENANPGTPAPASSFLNAFERSFESFLNNKVEEPASLPSSTKDQGSAAGISAILADSATGNQRCQNPLLSYQTQNSIKKHNHDTFVGYRKVEGKKFPSKTLTLSKTKTYYSNERAVEEKIKEKPTLVFYQDDESTEAVNNLLKAEAGTLSPERERRFACATCPKTFKNRGHLKEHEMIHTGDFPFHCENCSKGFRREASLLTHKCNGLVNSSESFFNANTSDFRGQKVYKCEQCERSYASKQYFQVHKCTKGNESVTRQQSKSLVNVETNINSTKSKVKKDNDDEKYLENVYIDVPVTVLSSKIIFRGDDNCAVIEGDIIDVDVEDITLEEAVIEGYQVETLSDHSNAVTIEGITMKPVPNSSLPCGLELMSLSSGIDVDEISRVIEFYSDDQSVETCLFPWQMILKDDPKKVNYDEKQMESKLLLEENEPGAGKLSNTLDELPSVFRSKSTDQPSNLNVSLNKFTYFNDTSIAYGSEDDADDSDWSEMSEKVKRKATSKSLSKKPSRNQSYLSHSEKRRSIIGQQKRAKEFAHNSSLLLQDDEDEDFKKEDRYDFKRIAFRPFI